MNKNINETPVQFVLNGKMYEKKKYDIAEIAMDILPNIYGESIHLLTYEKLRAIKMMLDKGWTLMPAFYGEKTDSGTLLCPQMSWFKIHLMNPKDNGNIVTFECCINYKTIEVTMYNKNRMIATFSSLFDLNFYMEQYNNWLPAKITTYDYMPDYNNVVAFDENGCKFDEIFKKDECVYSCLYENKLTFEVDYDKLTEVKITANC